TPPSVAILSPAPNAVLSGTVTVSATATDAAGVAGVQFQVDGANAGSEDTAPPYELALDTTALANGPHVLTAIARNVSGLTATSAAVQVIVAQAPDVTPPSVPTGLAARAVSPTEIDLSWNPSSDPDGAVAGYRVFRGGAEIATVTGTAYADSSV